MKVHKEILMEHFCLMNCIGSYAK